MVATEVGHLILAPRLRGRAIRSTHGAVVIVRVKVKPNSRQSALTQAADGSWIALLKAPPVDGKANAELVALIARRFQCRKSAVQIKTGASGRLKLVSIDV